MEWGCVITQCSCLQTAYILFIARQSSGCIYFLLSQTLFLFHLTLLYMTALFLPVGLLLRHLPHDLKDLFI